MGQAVRLLGCVLGVVLLAGWVSKSMEPYEGVMDPRATSACEGWAGGEPNTALLGAVDSTVGEAREIATASGLDPRDDTNLVDVQDSKYAALCLVRVPTATYLIYQFEGEARGGAIAKF